MEFPTISDSVESLRALLSLAPHRASQRSQRWPQSAMQSRLAFSTTADEVRQQRSRIAAEVAKAVAEQPPPPPPPQPPRPVGRPKRERTAPDALQAAAAAAATTEEEPAAKRGKYTNWFASPWIHDILREYARARDCIIPQCAGGSARTGSCCRDSRS